MKEERSVNMFKQAVLSQVWMVGIGLGLSGCASVDTIRLTNQTFPAKGSVQQVEVLDRKPTCAHVAIARLSVDDSEYDSFEAEQQKILKKAAALGADAVIFSKAQKTQKVGVTYSGLGCVYCGAWGYGYYGYPGWGYGPYGYGAGWGYGGMAIPYNYTVKSLKGVAIHYTDTTERKC